MGFITATSDNSLSESIVYKVEHRRLVAFPDVYDSKLIGFFSTKDIAEKVLDQHKTLKGFREYPQGFVISEMRLNPSILRKYPSLPHQVYYLYYWEENAEDDIDYVHDIGVFSSLDRARKAKATLINMFVYDKREEKHLFIEKYEIDKCFWCEGFD